MNEPIQKNILLSGSTAIIIALVGNWKKSQNEEKSYNVTLLD